MANCLVCNTGLDTDFGTTPNMRTVGDFDGFVCGAKCQGEYNRGVRHNSVCSSGTKCTGCGRNIDHMPNPVYSGDFDPFCSSSCKDDHSRRAWESIY